MWIARIETCLALHPTALIKLRGPLCCHGVETTPCDQPLALPSTQRGGRGMTQNEKRKRQNNETKHFTASTHENSETEQNVERALAARSGEIPVHPHPMSSPER
jgi:hypothetical protein